MLSDALKALAGSPKDMMEYCHEHGLSSPESDELSPAVRWRKLIAEEAMVQAIILESEYEYLRSQPAPLAGEKLAEIENRWAQTTPGPWTYSGGNTEDASVGYCVHHKERRWEDFGMPDGSYVLEDAVAMAASQDDVAYLLSEVKWLRAEVKRLKSLPTVVVGRQTRPPLVIGEE